ncbi:retrovirus-related pol polyprotein LINE-1 [Tanacetum coccineum]
MPRRSMTEAIHLLQSLIEKYRERQRDLHIAFLDLEKAYDSIPHDIVLIAESAEGLTNRLESWRKALEDNGLRVSKEKTEYLRCDFGRYEVVHQEIDIRIGDQILQPKESFRYLGLVLHRSGRIYVPKSKTSSLNDNSSTIFESMPLRAATCSIT